MSAQFAIGIDLGTTNSVLAYAPLDSEDEKGIELLPIPQFVAPGTIESLPSLPSFAYLATESETESGHFDLPWSSGLSYVVGEFARRRSSEAPDRTIGAAKSWLSQAQVERRHPILPWNAPEEVGKTSPVKASQWYLQHLVGAWQQKFPDAPIEQQQVVLTVPASFDPVARELTREAATLAGLPADLILLEEPQAALYNWLETVGDRWRKLLSVGDQVLVCDVGGGTTDLTLISIDGEDGDLVIRRVAVGNHLLVGGDNMDLAIAHHVAGEFAKKKTKLNPWQSVSLWHSCRHAKEKLLIEDGPAKESISVLGRGSKLIGGTVSVDVRRTAVASLLLDGFLPKCKKDEQPLQVESSGFQEIGLPYESDPAITRHIAGFLQTHCFQSSDQLPRHILFNGGVFKAEGFQNRMLEVINAWSTDKKDKIEPLTGQMELDHGVARGACSYQLNKNRGGLRIRGGTARSYYVGIETAGLAIPGAPRPLKAVCVVPFGMEEGSTADVPEIQVGLVLGKPTQFRFFSSSIRHEDSPGDELLHWEDTELIESDPLETTLTLSDESEDQYVPVRFHCVINELGVLELWCVGTKIEGRWKLEFSVREEDAEEG